MVHKCPLALKTRKMNLGKGPEVWALALAAMIITFVTLSKSLSFLASQIPRAFLPEAVPSADCCSSCLGDIWSLGVQCQPPSQRVSGQPVRSPMSGKVAQSQRQQEDGLRVGSAFKNRSGGGRAGGQAARAAVPRIVSTLDRCPQIQCVFSDLLNRSISRREWRRG